MTYITVGQQKSAKDFSSKFVRTVGTPDKMVIFVADTSYGTHETLEDSREWCLTHKNSLGFYMELEYDS